MPIYNLVKAIEFLANRMHQTVSPDEALKFSQAALNLAHAVQILSLSPERPL